MAYYLDQNCSSLPVFKEKLNVFNLDIEAPMWGYGPTEVVGYVCVVNRDVAKNFDVQGKTIIIYEDTVLSEDQYYLNGFLDIYLLHTDPNYKPWSAKEVRTGVDILDAVLRHSYIGQKDATPLFTAKLLMPDVSVGGFKQVVYGPGILDIDELNDGQRV